VGGKEKRRGAIVGVSERVAATAAGSLRRQTAESDLWDDTAAGQRTGGGTASKTHPPTETGRQDHQNVAGVAGKT
jgi:hypothetical protein